MALNYAEVWRPELIEIYRQSGLYVPFMTDNVKWLNAQTFHLTRMSTSGYKAHSRTTGWNVGTIAQNDNTYTLTHDRDISFPVDKLDVDETNATASIKNVAEVFTKTQKAPEGNALFFSKIAAAATSAGLYDTTATSTWTSENVYPRLKAMLKKANLRYYLSKNALIMYLSSDIMDLLEQSKDFTRKIEMTSLTNDGIGLNTRVTSMDGAYLIEVMDASVFYNKFNFTEGFLPVSKTAQVEGSKKINVLIASPLTTWFINKIDSIYYYAPGEDSSVGDCFKYCDRSLADCFVTPNGDTNAIDSVYVSLDTAEYGVGETPVLVSAKAILTNGTVIPLVDNALTLAEGAVLEKVEAIVNTEVTLIGTPKSQILQGETWVTHGTISIDSEDATKVIVTPDGSNGICSVPGEFSIRVPADSVKGTDSGNEEVVITLTVIAAEN